MTNMMIMIKNGLHLIKECEEKSIQTTTKGKIKKYLFEDRSYLEIQCHTITEKIKTF